MPKPKGRGGKNRKKAKSSGTDGGRRELIFAEDSQCYAFIIGTKGDGRFQLYCGDGRERIGIVRGKLWKRSWVRLSDIVLVSLRDYQDDKADIIHQYHSDEVLRLISMGEVNSSLTKHYNACEYEAAVPAGGDECLIVFENGDDIDLTRV